METSWKLGGKLMEHAGGAVRAGKGHVGKSRERWMEMDCGKWMKNSWKMDGTLLDNGWKLR